MNVARNLLIVAVFVVLTWLVLEALGFEMALAASLGLSVVLTLVLNLVLGGWRRRRATA